MGRCPWSRKIDFNQKPKPSSGRSWWGRKYTCRLWSSPLPRNVRASKLGISALLGLLPAPTTPGFPRLLEHRPPRKRVPLRPPGPRPLLPLPLPRTAQPPTLGEPRGGHPYPRWEAEARPGTPVKFLRLKVTQKFLKSSLAADI